MMKMLVTFGTVTHKWFNKREKTSVFMLYLWYLWEIDFSLPLIFDVRNKWKASSCVVELHCENPRCAISTPPVFLFVRLAILAFDLFNNNL